MPRLPRKSGWHAQGGTGLLQPRMGWSMRRGRAVGTVVAGTVGIVAADVVGNAALAAGSNQIAGALSRGHALSWEWGKCRQGLFKWQY